MFPFKSIKSLIILFLMLRLAFVFKASTFVLVASKLNFTLTPNLFSFM